jgi:hypothetical protein
MAQALIIFVKLDINVIVFISQSIKNLYKVANIPLLIILPLHFILINISKLYVLLFTKAILAE